MRVALVSRGLHASCRTDVAVVRVAILQFYVNSAGLRLDLLELAIGCMCQAPVPEVGIFSQPLIGISPSMRTAPDSSMLMLAPFALAVDAAAIARLGGVNARW